MWGDKETCAKRREDVSLTMPLNGPEARVDGDLVSSRSGTACREETDGSSAGSQGADDGSAADGPSPTPSSSTIAAESNRSRTHGPDAPPVGQQSVESCPSEGRNRDRPTADPSYVFVASLSPDGGLWPWITCFMASVMRFTTVGAWFFALITITTQDAFVRRAVCHLLSFHLASELVGPITDVFVNVCGFRYVMSVGSILLIIWSNLVWLEHNTLSICLIGFVGGCGVGTINETYGLLLPLLFTEKRALAQSIVYTSGILGIVILPFMVEFIITSISWLQVQLLLMLLSFITFGFSPLITVPYPFKIVALDQADVSVENRMSDEKIVLCANFNCRLHKKEHPSSEFSTVFDAISNRKIQVSVFTEESTSIEKMPDTRSFDVEIDQTDENIQIITRNIFHNFFMPKPKVLRPLYRDDIHFNGNVKIFAQSEEIKSILDYHMYVSRLVTVDELNSVWPKTLDKQCHPFYRSLKIVFHICGFNFEKLGVIFITDGAIHFIFFTILGIIQNVNKSEKYFYDVLALCLGLIFGRLIGFLGWERTPKIIPSNITSICVLISGLCIALHDMRKQKHKSLLALLCYGIFTELYRCGMKSILCVYIRRENFTQFHTYSIVINGILSTLSLFSIIFTQTLNRSAVFRKCSDALLIISLFKLAVHFLLRLKNTQRY